ncbi:MAG: hypothetical protein OHK006_13490 [Thermodesulfovibrionales bacterium]
MSENERPLPRPPKTPFGRKKPFAEAERGSLMADDMAMAAAEGRLEEYLKAELPDDENARRLAMMMMGMTGMMPQAAEAGTVPRQESPETPAETAPPPDDLLGAAASGDVANLVELLKREHRKRTGEEAAPAAPHGPGQLQGLTDDEKNLLDEMMRLAKDQNLSPDWIISRALRLYLDEYRRTGRL